MGWTFEIPALEEKILTAQGEGCQVDGHVMLFAGQFAVVALQVVSVTGVFSHPVHLVATVNLCGHLRSAALWGQITLSEKLLAHTVEKHENQVKVKTTSVCKLPNVCLMDRWRWWWLRECVHCRIREESHRSWLHTLTSVLRKEETSEFNKLANYWLKVLSPFKITFQLVK